MRVLSWRSPLRRGRSTFCSNASFLACLEEEEQGKEGKEEKESNPM